jgi:steroid 5-alpha reductase family enzyme
MPLVNCLPLPSEIVGTLLLLNAGLLFVYMTSWFIAARLRKRLDTVDIAWGLGFVVVAWVSALLRHSTRSWVIAVLVSIWGVRLASHIYRRAKTKQEDPRYEALARKWKGNFWLRAYVSIFLLQGLLILIVSIPIVMATNHQYRDWSWLTIAGGLVWLIGFAIEATADRQLAAYSRLTKRPKVLQKGLWKYSRHPNYFGELIQWWGIGIIALQTHHGWIGLFGPLVLSILIVFVSGIPPIERRRAKDLAYRAYQKKTSPLILLPQKKS